MSSILRDDSYFNNETDFCKIFSDSVLQVVEDILLENRISYFIKEQDSSILARLFSNSKECRIVRINTRDIHRAVDLIYGIRGAEIICDEPKEDWSPKRKLLSLQQAGTDERYYGYERQAL